MSKFSTSVSHVILSSVTMPVFIYQPRHLVICTCRIVTSILTYVNWFPCMYGSTTQFSLTMSSARFRSSLLLYRGGVFNRSSAPRYFSAPIQQHFK